MDTLYAQTVRLLLAVAPDVFANEIFAMKGGTAINLFVQNMPRWTGNIRATCLTCGIGINPVACQVTPSSVLLPILPGTTDRHMRFFSAIKKTSAMSTIMVLSA